MSFSYSYNLLTFDEQKQVDSRWRDCIDPEGFIYTVDKAGQVIGRQALGQVDQAPLPQPVRSSQKTFKLTSVKSLIHNGRE